MRTANTPAIKAQDYRTLRQWIDAGRLPHPDIPGELMYTNGFRQYISRYWGFSETQQATPEELAVVRKELRNIQNARRRKLYGINRKRKQMQQAENARREQEYQEYLRRMAPIWEENQRRAEKRRQHKESVLPPAIAAPPRSCNNPSGVVVFDLETTGLDPGEDEILQISAIDGDGNILLNSYVRPYIIDAWPEAQAINGITPDMVKTAPEIHELIPTLKGIFSAAKLLVSYNGNSFDCAFLRAVGIDTDDIPHYDVMLAFAPTFGEWDEYHQDYRWQSLITCAEYYGYSFKAHNSLEDCKTTLHCYRRMMEQSST